MASAPKKWLVKLSDGRVEGPFTTREILTKIAHSKYSGEEEVALYPGGQWIVIAKEPHFYDRLLEILSRGNAIEEDEEETTFTGMAPKESQESDSSGEGKRHGRVVRQSLDKEEKLERDKKSPPNSEYKSQQTEKKKVDPEVIELKNIDKDIKTAKRKLAIRPILFAVAMILILGFLFIDIGNKPAEGFNLIAPKSEKLSLSAEETKSMTQRAIRFYLQDTFKNYVQAQNAFVKLVESNKNNSDVLALLCLTYWELWPYTDQSVKSQRVVDEVTRLATATDPTGVNGNSCRVVAALVTNQFDTAKSIIDSILAEYGNSPKPPIAFYYLKAVQLDLDGDPRLALGYVSSAQKLWPQWLRVYSYEAELYLKIGEVAEATNRFQQVLEANAKHVKSMIELGILEYREFNHYNKAEALLRKALNGDDRSNRIDMSRAHFGLAEIALYKNDRSEALEQAEKSFSYNNANKAAQNLIRELGGAKKLKAQGVKGQHLIYEGDQYVREGDCNAAQAHYKSAFEVNPNNGIAAMKAAKCLWTLSFSTEAIDWMNKAIKADNSLIEAYTLLADYYSQRYNFIAAAKILAAAKSMAPKNYEIYRGYALVELRRKNAAGAEKFSQVALKLYQSDVDTHVIMARAQRMMRKYREAFATAARAVELDPNNREAQIVYAQTLAGVRGYELGISQLTDLVNRYPNIIEYRQALADMMLEDQRYDNALEVYSQITKLLQKPKEALLGMAKIYRIREDLKSARDVLLRASILDPADAEPLFQLGQIYLDLKQYVEARKQFQRVGQVNPLYPKVNYFIGKTELAQNRFKSAIQYAEKEKSLNPKLADAYLLAAEAHKMLRQYSLCAQEYQQALALRSQGAEIYIRVSECYIFSGNLDNAQAMLNRAQKIESGNPMIYRTQGILFEKKGEAGAAIEAYEQYFALSPNAPDIPRLRARIRRLQSQ